MPFPWHVQDNPSEVTPLHDLQEHIVGPACWCRPRTEDDVLIHNALDGREMIENGQLRLN